VCEKFAKKPKEEEDCCVVITIGVGLLLVVVIPVGDVAFIVVTLEGDKRKRRLVGGNECAETS
jgi:hypothetical protein